MEQKERMHPVNYQTTYSYSVHNRKMAVHFFPYKGSVQAGRKRFYLALTTGVIVPFLCIAGIGLMTRDIESFFLLTSAGLLWPAAMLPLVLFAHTCFREHTGLLRMGKRIQFRAGNELIPVSKHYRYDEVSAVFIGACPTMFSTLRTKYTQILDTNEVWDEVFGNRYIVCARGAAEDQIFCVDYNDEVFHLLKQRCTHAVYYDSREAWLKKVEEDRVHAAEIEKNMLQKMGYDEKRGYIN